MKARVKATDRIIQVMNVMDKNGNGVWEEISDMSNNSPQYMYDELEFLDIPNPDCMQKEKSTEPDYWEKLKHQYAGMAMQAMISNSHNTDYHKDWSGGYGKWRKYDNKELAELAEMAVYYATALVNKLKEESQCEK